MPGWPWTGLLLVVLVLVAAGWRFRSWLMGVFENVEVLGTSGADLETELLHHQTEAETSQPSGHSDDLEDLRGTSAISPPDASPPPEPEGPPPDPDANHDAEAFDANPQPPSRP
jgi:hypothetical protein